MAEQVILDVVVMDILKGLSQVIKEVNYLNDARVVLYMTLSGLQFSKEETGVSVNVDCTGDYIADYLRSMFDGGCTKGSINGYRNEINKLFRYLGKGVTDVSYEDLREYLRQGKLEKGWKDATYNHKLIVIRSFFTWLYNEDKLLNNPAKKLKEAKVERRMCAILEPEDREIIRCACQSELELALCDVLYSSGVRISELCALDISDINFKKRSAVVYGKGRKEREIYFSNPAKMHLKRYLKSRTDDNPALFVREKKPHDRITPGGVRYMLKKIKSRDEEVANIILTPHVFRRTMGTEMINRGAPLELVAEMLGHVQVDTTKQCYAKIARETVRQAHDRYIGV